MVPLVFTRSTTQTSQDPTSTQRTYASLILPQIPKYRTSTDVYHRELLCYTLLFDTGEITVHHFKHYTQENS